VLAHVQPPETSPEKTMIRVHPSPALMAALLLVILMPGTLEAQRRGRAPQRAPRQAWPAATIGAQVGYDDVSQGNVLGAQIRVPVLRNAKVALMPSANVTFLTGLKEYQLNLDAVFVPGGRRGGIYVAGGLAARNTIFLGESERETRTGVGVAAGILTGAESRVGVQLEFRQIFVDEDLRPRLLTLGINVALWGGGRQPGR
jgi:hypothetical protein